jgi:hypothetical protein
MKAINYVWQEVEIIDSETGEAIKRLAMVPTDRYAKLAASQHHEGEPYTLVQLEERSQASHNAYFAELHSYWENLPEKIAARWPSENHFRRWLLVETGWFTESEIECASAYTAKQTAGLVRDLDGYARISVHGNKVIIKRAKSQSRIAMPEKQDFERSKRATLELAAQFVGVSPSQMKREAQRAVS